MELPEDFKPVEFKDFEGQEACLFEAFVIAPCLFSKKNVEVNVGKYTLRLVSKDKRLPTRNIGRFLMILFSTLASACDKEDIDLYLSERDVIKLCSLNENDTRMTKFNRAKFQLNLEIIRNCHLEIRKNGTNDSVIKVNFIDFLDWVSEDGFKTYVIHLNRKFSSLCKNHSFKFSYSDFLEQKCFIKQSIFLLSKYLTYGDIQDPYYLTSDFVFKVLGYDSDNDYQNDEEVNEDNTAVLSYLED